MVHREPILNVRVGAIHDRSGSLAQQEVVRLIVYHVTSMKKLDKYRQSGCIKAPVRAWETLEHANRFSIGTGRPIILRLNFPVTAPKLSGHFGAARVIYYDYKITDILGGV